MAYPVKLHVYDLTQGMARAMSMPMVGVKPRRRVNWRRAFIAGSHSLGIAVYGYEFFFSGGIQAARCDGGPGCRAACGCTATTSREADRPGLRCPSTTCFLREFLKERADEFTMATYNLRSWNCNNFSDECAQFLLGCSIPRRIVGFAEDVLALPQLAGFAMMVENMGNPAQSFAAQHGRGDRAHGAAAHRAGGRRRPAAGARRDARADRRARRDAGATQGPHRARRRADASDDRRDAGDVGAAPPPAERRRRPLSPPTRRGARRRRCRSSRPPSRRRRRRRRPRPPAPGGGTEFSTPAFVTPAAGGRRQVAPNDVAPLLAVGARRRRWPRRWRRRRRKRPRISSRPSSRPPPSPTPSPLRTRSTARAATLGAALTDLLRAVPTASQFAPLYACRILAASAEFVAAFLGGGASATLLAGALAHGAPRSVRLMALTTLGNAAGGVGCREFLVEAPAPELAKLLGAALVAAGEAADAALADRRGAVHNIALRLPADGAAEEVDVAVAAGLLRGMLLKDLHMVRDASLSAEVVRRLLLALGFVLHGASSGTREAARAGGHGTEEALAAAAARAAGTRIGAIVDEVRALLL